MLSKKVTQTLSRVGAGLAAMAGLAWFLWPFNDTPLLNREEPLFVFVVALVVWVFAEFKSSEPFAPPQFSQNDIRTARRLISLHTGEFRHLLKDWDVWSYEPWDNYGVISKIIYEWENDRLFFHNSEFNADLERFVGSLIKFKSKMAQDTVPETINGKMFIGYKPYRLVSETDFQWRRREANDANSLADSAWEKFNTMALELRNSVPQALETPLDSY